MKRDISPKTLRILYWNQEKSLSETAAIFGVSHRTVLNRMKEFGIPRRSVAESLRGREITWAEKIAEANRGKVLSKATKTAISVSRKSDYTPAWNRGLSKVTHPDQVTYGASGEAHWAWKGGISGERNRIRASSAYKFWRKAVFQRDNWTCVKCGQRGGYLEADHIKGFAEYPELRFEVSNGQTLCKPCHRQITNKRARNVTVSEVANVA